MDYLDVIQQRYSVRSYKPDMIEPEKLHTILECARLAPTAANRQAFKIIVVNTAGRREALKKIYPRDWFVEAPYVLGVCSVPSQNWVRADKKNYSDVDAAIVMDHIILAATALKLGTCWIAGFDALAAQEILELDPTWEPVAFTPLGYPSDTPKKKVRKTIEELVIYK
ncbi:MAG: nitroreductase family protein [Firmicutes bacterium]|nr:nitroreductase family protein [Bacillota bacterium]